MNRTVRVILQPTPEQAEILTETARQFTGAFNLVCAHGWRERCKNGVTLHQATYYPLRAKHPALVCGRTKVFPCVLPLAVVHQKNLQGKRVSASMI